jgi:Helix-turn-helix domain
VTDDPDRYFVLTPLDHAEALTLQEAADRSKKVAGTIRNWCESEGIGRRIGGKWYVSKVALEMYLDGEEDALARYLRGDRESKDVIAYFNRFGLFAQKPILF